MPVSKKRKKTKQSSQSDNMINMQLSAKGLLLLEQVRAGEVPADMPAEYAEVLKAIGDLEAEANSAK